MTDEMGDNQTSDVATLDLREALGLVDDELLSPGSLDPSTRVGIDVQVNGEPYDPAWTQARRTPCQHAGTVNVNTLAANVLGEKGEVLSRQLRVRVRCSDCGCRLVPELEGTFPRDGIPGIVLYLTPTDDDPATGLSAPVT